MTNLSCWVVFSVDTLKHVKVHLLCGPMFQTWFCTYNKQQADKLHVYSRYLRVSSLCMKTTTIFSLYSESRRGSSYVCMWVSEPLPGGFLLQLWNIWHIEHDSKEEQWLIAKLIQLLLEGFLQFHPAMGWSLSLSMEPQPKVMGLETRRDEQRVSVAQKLKR